MERKNGFLIVDDYKELPADDCIFRGVYAKCWLQDKDIYLFKSYAKSFSCYREMIYSRFATKLGIPNVGYDLALYKGNFGVITKKCTKNMPVSVKQLLLDFLEEEFDYVEEEFFYRMITMPNIERVLKNRYQSKDSFLLDEMHKNLFIKFISQILFANPDLNAQNLDFDEDICNFLPLYDFGSCGSINYNAFKGGANYFSLKRFYTEEMEEHPSVTLKNFLECAEREEVLLFREYLERACTYSLEDMYSEIEEDIGVFLPNDVQSLKKSITKYLQATEKHCGK